MPHHLQDKHDWEINEVLKIDNVGSQTKMLSQEKEGLSRIISVCVGSAE